MLSIPYRFRLREKRRPGLRLRDFAVSPGIHTWQRRPGIVSRRMIAAVREAGVLVFPATRLAGGVLPWS